MTIRVDTVVLLLLITSVTLPQAAHTPQSKSKGEARVPNRDHAYTFDDLLNRDLGAIADEKRYFARLENPKLKQRVASILLAVGVRDKIYFDYLVVAARKALNDETPWPSLYDEDGEMNTKATHPVFSEWMKRQGLDPSDPKFAALREYNPAFIEWCKKRNLEPNQAQYDAYYLIPEPWYYLAAAGDLRAYYLLIQGLHSHNLMIAANAAKGLAKLQDPRAIPELIKTGRQVPGEARLAIAWSLVFFSDPKAQAAADELVTKKELINGWREEVKKNGFKVFFQW
jgi:hypothetical protein